MKLCILFPGIGYHCEKPLLYYSSRLAKNKGYDVLTLKFSDFPKNAKGNEEKMLSAAGHALSQAEEQLSDIEFSRYDEIILVGKSIGTKAALAFRDSHSLNAKTILLTPLKMTFEHDASGSIAFHGTSDQWASASEIRRLCKENNVPLHEYEDANHSIETDDIFRSLSYLRDVMEKIDKFID